MARPRGGGRSRGVGGRKRVYSSKEVVRSAWGRVGGGSLAGGWALALRHEICAARDAGGGLAGWQRLLLLCALVRDLEPWINRN